MTLGLIFPVMIRIERWFTFGITVIVFILEKTVIVLVRNK
jgi:hypothetical protein